MLTLSRMAVDSEAVEPDVVDDKGNTPLLVACK
jgi:hypothetical protein